MRLDIARIVEESHSIVCYAATVSAGHANLIGAQHFMTFDRQFYEFAGDCSYLLMRDFIGGTFSVIVNYDRAVQGRPVKKSLTIITGGQLEMTFSTFLLSTSYCS